MAAGTVLFASDLLGGLVLTKSDELRVTEVVVGGPLEEIDLCDEDWSQPAAVLHLTDEHDIYCVSSTLVTERPATSA